MHPPVQAFVIHIVYLFKSSFESEPQQLGLEIFLILTYLNRVGKESTSNLIGFGFQTQIQEKFH